MGLGAVGKRLSDKASNAITLPKDKKKRVAVVYGGGIFGLALAAYLARKLSLILQRQQVDVHQRSIRIMPTNELKLRHTKVPPGLDTKHYMTVVVDNAVLPGTPNRIFHLLTASADFMRAWFGQRGLKQVTLTRWNLLQDGTTQRVVRYQVPISNPMAPDYGSTTERQQVVWHDRKQGVFQIRIQAVTPNVPLGYSFQTNIKLQCLDLKKQLRTALADLTGKGRRPSHPDTVACLHGSGQPRPRKFKVSPTGERQEIGEG